MELLYTSMYNPGAPYLRFLVIAFALFAFLDIFSHALMVSGRYFVSAIIPICLLPVALLLNVSLIQQLGAVGAAIAVALTIGIGASIAMLLAYRRFGSLIKNGTLTRMILATVVIAITSTQIHMVGAWLLLKFACLFGLYALLLYLLKELSKEDLRPFALWQKGPG